MSQQQVNVNVTLDKTTKVECEKCQHDVFTEGLMLRKASKFLTGTAQDALIPIPVMYNVSTNKILLDMIPKEIRDDYKDIGFTLGK